MGLEGEAITSGISVIIPTHLRPNLLKEAIESILAQAHRPDEIIVVDDANDELTREVVQVAGRQSSVPIIYVWNDKAPGACGSRNCGAFRSTGSLIAFLDDDDLWHPEFLSELAFMMQSSPADFVMSGLNRHEEGELPYLRATPRGLTSQDIVAYPRSMTGSNVLYRKSAFSAVGGFDRSVPVFNDWDLFIRLVDAGFSYDVVPRGLAEWRWHSGDRIATFSLKRARGLRMFLQKYGRRMKPRTYRDFKATAIGIERKNATGLRRMWKSAELVFAHGAVGSINRLFGMHAAI